MLLLHDKLSDSSKNNLLVEPISSHLILCNLRKIVTIFGNNSFFAEGCYSCDEPNYCWF